MSSIKLFESKQIRSIWSEGDQKWYFSIVDVVAALTDNLHTIGSHGWARFCAHADSTFHRYLRDGV